MEMLEASQWQRPSASQNGKQRETVATMLAEIRARGDEAIRDFSQRIDGFAPEVYALPKFEDIPLEPELRQSLLVAAARIEGFARLQMGMFGDVEGGDQFGRYGQRVLPLERMAAYIPGGRYPLVSTALMTLIPARVAGVPQRVAMSPSDHPAIQAAASLAGATRFVRIGGAQAIAAAALGSSWIEPVNMIVGPGNAYVNAAKALLQVQVKIDCLAGPSEILILCDEKANPSWVALDVLAQAEHDPMALSVVASCSQQQLQAVAGEIERWSQTYPEKDKGCIQLVHCQSKDEQIDLANRMAPEHLHLDCQADTIDPQSLQNYGSLFLGSHSAVALGDYCTGPNHTLPTLGHARQKGGLCVGDFLKLVTWQQINPNQYNNLAQTAIRLAQEENLSYHEESLKQRLTSNKL